MLHVSRAHRSQRIQPQAREPAYGRGSERRVGTWLRSTPENACDADCGQCSERALTLEQAPFRLTAIAYRPDPALLPNAQCPQGQLRFVFALRGEVSSRELHAPERFWADSVSRATPSPAFADAKLTEMLRLVSCQGCHADERSQDGFHIAPRARARVSRFLHDPERPEDDELTRRADALRTLLRSGGGD